MSDSRSLRDWLDQAPGGVGLLVADIVSSVDLHNQHGTHNYDHLIACYRERAHHLAATAGGRIIDHHGDEVLAAFPRAADAYRMGLAFFEDAGHPELAVRVGIHFDTLRIGDNGVPGRAVPFAKRVLDKAVGREIWMSDAAKLAIEREALVSLADTAWVTRERCQLQGFTDLHVLWRVM